MKAKLFRLFFPSIYKEQIKYEESVKALANVIRKKEAVIQILQRRMRRMEREK